MARLLQNLLSQRFVGLFGLVVLLVVVYVVGWLSGVPWWVLHTAAGAAVAAALAAMFWQKQKATKAASQLEAALRAQGQSQAAGARPDQRAGIEELKSTFDESLELLRSSKMGRGALHSIPWYILIGPPGSGKSTLLRESGLSFPYMTKGRSAIRGLGGTKNCDWWFADRGILLDTAGRYTTEADDRDEWLAFLRLMKRGRGRRPVNGAIVAIGLADLVEATDAELSLYAENVRDRIDELTRELQVVFPVYLVFTKCDRLRGFVETFDTLTKEQRKQVWGFTFPGARGRDFDLADRFTKEFRELYQALCVRRVDLLASDHFKKRKAQVYAFPTQFLHLEERLQAFLSQVQQPNPYQEVSPVRGVYFTSGTQEGTTIDKILKVLRPAELELDVPQDSRRCYFVDDLFNRVVFPDATLAAPTAHSQQRERRLRIGGAVALGVLALAVVIWRWGVKADFAAACDTVAQSIVRGDAQDPAAVRDSLDAQLHLLDGENHHLHRGGVVAELRRHYDRALLAHANERIAAVAAEATEAARAAVGKAKGQPRAEANHTLRAAALPLERIERGVEGLLRDGDTGLQAAQELWRWAIGARPDDERHLERLRTIEGRRLAAPDEARLALREIADRLGEDDRADFDKAKLLPPEQLFPATHAYLTARKTRLVDLLALRDQDWGQGAREAHVPGPLLSTKSAKPGAPTLEEFFATFEADVVRAKDWRGELSDEPLHRVVGTEWEQHLASVRTEFLAQFERGFAARWTAFLDAQSAAARAGGAEPSDDRTGTGRLAVLPELVVAYRVAAQVVNRGVRGEQVTPEMRDAMAEEARKNVAARTQEAPAWGAKPGVVRSDATTAAIVERAQAALKYLERERPEIERFDWGINALRQDLHDLDLALTEALCHQEWTACRRELQAIANKSALPAWNQAVGLFPFAAQAVEEADGKMLEKALQGMNELAQCLAELRPAAAFELDATFADQLRNAQELGRMLYGESGVQPSPRVDAELFLQKEQPVARATLESQQRRYGIGSKREPWSMQPDTLKLSIEANDALFSFRDLVDPRQQQTPAHHLIGDTIRGLWAMKRVCSIGAIQPGRDADSRICELTVRDGGGKLFLHLKPTRPEASRLFDADWPGDRFQRVTRMWKNP